MLDRYPFNSPWVRDVIRRGWLPFWFVLMSAPGILVTIRIQPIMFFDARLYLMATRAWLAGIDPWTVDYRGYFFAAPPPTLLPLVPLTLLPDPIDWLVLGALVVAGAIITIRVLKLPWYWLLFPPVVHGIISGNVQLLLVPLLLVRGAWLAPILKGYAALPMVLLGRWRALLVGVLVLVLSAPFLPWASYIANFAAINGTLAEQARYGLSGPFVPILVPVGLACLVIVGRQAAAWLVVPALWPSQQWYYATLVMPLRSDLVGAIVALPLVGSAYIALVAVAIATIASALREGTGPTKPTRGARWTVVRWIQFDDRDQSAAD